MRGLSKSPTIFGRWEPGGFPPTVTLMVKLTLFTMMLTRGIDLSAGDTGDTSRRLSTMAEAGPLWFWGAILSVGACMGIASMAFRHYRSLAWAHVFGWAMYWALAVAIIWDVWDRSTDFAPGGLPHSFYIALGMLAVVWAIHFVHKWEHSLTIAIGATLAFIFAGSSIELDGLRNAVVLLGVGTIHMLMAIGTAARARRQKWKDKGGGELWI